MSFSGQSRQSALNLVLLTGVFSLVGLFLALGVGADRADRFSKTCSMGMACCVAPGRGNDCTHVHSESGHDVPPGFRRGVRFELEAACGCPASASAFLYRNDSLITPFEFLRTRFGVNRDVFFKGVPGFASLQAFPVSLRAPPSFS
jgi:hypothetical protein